MAAVIDLIAHKASRIVERWADEAAAAASAQGLSRAEVLDNFPGFMSMLVRRLSGADGVSDVVRDHGLEMHVGVRLRQGYELADAMAEYTLLGRCIVQACVDEGLHDFSGLERVFEELQRAQTLLVRVYTQHLLEDEQSEKRYLRLLDAIAAEAAESDSQGLPARLTPFLLTLAGGLGAHCGGLFLLDTDEQLALRARTGSCVDERDFPRQRADGPGMLGDIARAEGSYAWSSTEMTLPRLSSHAIVGVPLRARGRLIGVAWVGYHDRKQVDARAERRLEVLGRRLALLIDGTRLSEELQARVRELQEERDLRDRFVSVLAHDLRGPLSAAKVSAELLAEHAVDDRLRGRLVDRVVRGIERTDRMVRDLLDASRVRAGQPLPIHRESSDLSQIAAEALEEVTAVYGDRFLLEAGAAVPGWFGAGELRRAIANLAANGAKYGDPDGQVSVSVAQRGSFAEVRVHNDGPAISDEVKRRLFQPFSQATLGRGWGLGLTLVAGAVQAHGGTVSVESNAHGTTFTLRLPLQSEAELHP